MIRLSGIIHVMYKALNMCLVSAHEVDVDANDRPRTSTPLSTDAGSLSPDLSPLSEEGDTNVRVLPEPVGEPSVTSPRTHITEKEARMAVSLTEYFQEQRSVYKHLKVRESKENSADTLAYTILSTSGAFCTPRSVIRSVTLRKKPTSKEVIDQMNTLEEDGVGKLLVITERENVFYKPLPTEDNMEKISPVNLKFITKTQHNRLLKKVTTKTYSWHSIATRNCK